MISRTKRRRDDDLRSPQPASQVVNFVKGCIKGSAIKIVKKTNLTLQRHITYYILS